METKKCSQCKKVKELSEFSNDIRYSYGVKGICRRCTQDNVNKKRKENPEKYRKIMNDWIHSRPDLAEKRRITYYINYLKGRGFVVEFIKLPQGNRDFLK